MNQKKLWMPWKGAYRASFLLPDIWSYASARLNDKGWECLQPLQRLDARQRKSWLIEPAAKRWREAMENRRYKVQGQAEYPRWRIQALYSAEKQTPENRKAVGRSKSSGSFLPVCGCKNGLYRRIRLFLGRSKFCWGFDTYELFKSLRYQNLIFV